MKLAGSKGDKKSAKRLLSNDCRQMTLVGTAGNTKVLCEQGRRVTTATPEQTQGRSDERALAEAKMLDQCAFIERGARAFGRIASTIDEK